MGAVQADQVPDFGVFEDQAQFDAGASTIPVVDTAVSGAVRSVSIRDVIREHGARSGPTPTLWRRATVVISTDHLASQHEMDYWNFFAQRLADRTNTATPTYDGYVPLHVATNDAVHLVTAIEPTAGPILPEMLNTDTPTFATRDWRGVEFTESVSTRFSAGARRRLSGRVTATDAVDFNQVGLIFYQAGNPDPVKFYTTVSRSGDFSVDVSFTDAQRGRYMMGVFLFWPNSGAQYARTMLSTIVVQ
jgi:hypothetical protein